MAEPQPLRDVNPVRWIGQDTMYLHKVEAYMRAQMVKWGNSLAVRIPKAVAEEAKLAEGDALELDVAPDGTVQLQRIGKAPTLSQLVAQITPENRYEEVDWGKDVDNEKVDW